MHYTLKTHFIENISYDMSYVLLLIFLWYSFSLSLSVLLRDIWIENRVCQV